MMHPSEHPTTAMVLARYRMQEEIARAEAYRTAKQARAAQREAAKAAREARSGAHSRGVSLLTFLRGAAGRA
jgi:hypothetical protein